MAMSQDRKSESGRILKEEEIQKDLCREAMKNLGTPNDRPEKLDRPEVGATKRLRKEKSSH